MATIKDIAEKSGVSVSAVSRILKNYPKQAKTCLSWEFCNGFHKSRTWRIVIT